MEQAKYLSMKILVTGFAGFIGAHVCGALLRNGSYEVVGVDDFNPYYDVALKQARVQHFAPNIRQFSLNIADDQMLCQLLTDEKPDIVIHLAAQASVRHSFRQPMDYAKSNLTGHLALLEAIRYAKSVKRLIYASSSSVYSGVKNLPFSEDNNLGTPKSLYAATKIADEILADTYSQLFEIDAIGLRFFTVYGPWGRPDMAYWAFAQALLNGDDINLFNHGNVRRDFTYIDDVVPVILKMVEEVREQPFNNIAHRIYNVGNQSPEPVRRMISILETHLGVEANIALKPLPPGDMVETYANIEKLRRDYGVFPRTPLDVGLRHFAEWFLEWQS